LAHAAPAGAENRWAAACLARAAGRHAGGIASLEESVSGWEHLEARFERAITLLLMPGREAEGLAELDALGCPPPAAGYRRWAAAVAAARPRWSPPAERRPDCGSRRSPRRARRTARCPWRCRA